MTLTKDRIIDSLYRNADLMKSEAAQSFQSLLEIRIKITFPFLTAKSKFFYIKIVTMEMSMIRITENTIEKFAI